MNKSGAVIQTPVGIMPFPMNPGHSKKVEKYKTNEDLFSLVEVNGFIDPDALNTIVNKGLYWKYCEWKGIEKEPTPVTDYLKSLKK